MEHEFWQAKWRANEIGFHQAQVHPLLVAQWPRLGIARDARVLVPLCGKSHDLAWLRDSGPEVVGLELSEIAVAAYFAERSLTPTSSRTGPYTVYATDRLTLFCGDVFAATPAWCGRFDAIYDRAALIALAPTQRTAYLATLRGLCGPGARGLLITVEYPEGLIAAPPFSIATDEVMALYTPWADVRELERRAADVKGHAAVEVAYEFVVRDK
jgi:thiopurine S-methyltransferase